MRLGVALFVALLLVGCYDRFDGAPKSATPNVVSANVTIKYLDQLLGSREYADITSDCVVSGRVVATDECGNFYRSFVMQDGEMGVEVLEGLSNSYVRHPLGAQMAVDFKGLRLSRYNGVLQVGVAAEVGSYTPVTYMSHELIVDRHVTNCGVGAVVDPRVVSLEELMVGDGSPVASPSRYYGSLVRIDDLRLVADSSQVVMWGGWLKFADSQGREVLCYNSSYADYAEQIVPCGELSLVGILQSYRSSGSSVDHVAIKMRSLEDCVIVSQ